MFRWLFEFLLFVLLLGCTTAAQAQSVGGSCSTVPSGSLASINSKLLICNGTTWALIEGFATSGNVGIGTTTMNGVLNVHAPSTTASGSFFAAYVDGAQSVADTGSYFGLFIAPTYTATSGNTLANMVAIQAYGTNSSTGTISNMWGVTAQPQNASSGTVGNMYGVYGVPQKSGTGAVSNMYGTYGRCDNQNASGAVTNCYALYADTPTTIGAITNKYGVYQADSASSNFFAGNVGIGTTSPAFSLDVYNPGTGIQIVSQIKSADAGFEIGSFASGYGGIWSSGVTPSAANFALVSSGGETDVNSTSNVLLDINNTPKLALNSNGVAINNGGTGPTSGNGLIVTSGNVGIGISSPGAKVDIEGGSSNVGLLVNGNTQANTHGIFGYSWTSGFQAMHAGAEASGAYAVVAQADASGAIALIAKGGGGACQFNYGNTSWSCSSDERLKQDIKPVSNALDRLALIKGVTFRWRADPRTGEKMGVIAQDVLKAFPAAVTLDVHPKGSATSYYSVDYNSLVGPLISGVNELNTRTAALQTDNDDLRALLAAQGHEITLQGREIEELKAEMRAAHR